MIESQQCRARLTAWMSVFLSESVVRELLCSEGDSCFFDLYFHAASSDMRGLFKR